MKRHTDRGYEVQLSGIRDSLLRMSGRVEEMLADAIQALIQADAALAAQVVARDDAVDRLEGEIDSRCLSVLARYQPVASDLRLVTLALKAVRDLERIGDLAASIAKRVPTLAGTKRPWTWDHAAEMSKVTQGMLEDVMRALVNHEPEVAERVVAQDARVDVLYHQMFEAIMEGMRQEPLLMGDGIHSLSIAKWLERAADHATNLAEQVIFVTRGTDVRHGAVQASGVLR